MFDVKRGKYETLYGSPFPSKLIDSEDVPKITLDMSILNPEDLIQDTPTKLDTRNEMDSQNKIQINDQTPMRTVPLEARINPTIPVILFPTNHGNGSNGLRTVPSVSTMQIPPISTLVPLDESSHLHAINGLNIATMHGLSSLNSLNSLHGLSGLNNVISFPTSAQDILSDPEKDDEYDSDRKRNKNKKRKMKRDDTEGNILTNEQFWLERFNELKEFFREYQHCNPSYLHHSQLYSWLHRQKFLFRKGKLPKDRYEMLVDLGVHFDYHWDEMYVQLKEFKDDHGSSPMPLEFDSKLSSWVWAQIYAWRSGKLSEERIHKMEELGLSPDMDSNIKPPKPPSKKKRRKMEELDPTDKQLRSAEKKSEQNWVLMYKKLKEFKDTQHTLTVPMKYDKKLSLWVRTQRKMWREGKLFDWKQKKLEKLGLTPNFELSTKKDLPDLDDGADASDQPYQVHPHMVQGQMIGDNDDDSETEIHIQANQTLNIHPSEHDMGHMIHTSEDDGEVQEEQVYGSTSAQQSSTLLGLSDTNTRSSSKHITEEISHLEMLATYLNNPKEQPYLENVSSSDLNG